MAAVALAAVAAAADGQTLCPRADLPAYSHNDYANRRPLLDALDLGFHGVEADVFLAGDSLRVGHDRGAAARGGTLQALYIEPLLEIIARCGSLGGDRPFLFTVELKDRSPAARAALTLALGRFDSAPASRVLVVIVPDADPRLVSLNYGKTIGRWWMTGSRRRRHLEEIRRRRAAAPSVLFRAHNVPLDRRVYDALLDAGIDFIGTKDLTTTRRLLTGH